MKYCNQCGSTVSHLIPEGDDRPRYVCDTCRVIHYENPKMVVGCIPLWDDHILLCRRAIEPRFGRWTIPAGFLENGETVEEGAKRETYEEAGAKVEALKTFALFNLTFINQIYLIFRCRLEEPAFRAGHESLEVKLFKEEDLPWDHLAFEVVRETLQLFFEDRRKGLFSFHVGDIVPRAGHRRTRAQ